MYESFQNANNYKYGDNAKFRSMLTNLMLPDYLLVETMEKNGSINCVIIILYFLLASLW